MKQITPGRSFYKPKERKHMDLVLLKPLEDTYTIILCIIIIA